MKMKIAHALMPSQLFCLCLLFFTGTVAAHTLGQVEAKCPLCGTEFSYTASFSGHHYDVRLDFKEIGAIYQPWPIPQCPLCRYAFSDSKSEEKLTQEEKKALNDFIASPEFKAIPEEAPSYFYLARFMKVLGKPAVAIGFAYLQASWQAEGTKELDGGGRGLGWKEDPAMIRLALQESLRSLDGAEEAEETPARLNAVYLKVELNRRLGDFSQAEKCLGEARAEFAGIIEKSGGKRKKNGLANMAMGLSTFLDQQEPLIAARNAEPTLLDRTARIEEKNGVSNN